MNKKIMSIIFSPVLLSTMFVTAQTTTEQVSSSENPSPELQQIFTGADVPIWEEGTYWTYTVDKIDFTLSEIEGRSIDFHITTGEIKLKVATANGPSYRTEISGDVEVTFDINFDLCIDGKPPIIVSGSFSDASIDGDIYFDKNTLGIRKVDFFLSGVAKINSTSPIDISFIAGIPIPLDINVVVDFIEPYTFIDFPVETGKTWGLPADNGSIDGQIKSIWFRVLHIVNRIASLFGMDLISPELAELLPVIEFSELFEAFNMSNEIQFPKVSDLFECESHESITVPAGTYTTYGIGVFDEIANLYYAPDLGFFAKIRGNFKDIMPFFQDINVDLVETGSESV